MAKTVTKIMLQMIAGANVATIVAMLATGYSGYINPAVSPWLANAALVFPVFLFLNFAFLIFWLFFKPLYAIIPFVGMVIGFTPIRTYCPFNIPSAAPEGAIKVMSYNVWGYGTDKNVDGTNIVVQYIADSDADIVCLQEANASAEVQAQIDSLLYTKYAYHDTLQRKDKGGLATSRYATRRSSTIPRWAISRVPSYLTSTATTWWLSATTWKRRGLRWKSARTSRTCSRAIWKATPSRPSPSGS